MRYLSVCSGIEAASAAWDALGWSPVGFAEIDKGASRVLAHRFGSNMPGEPLSQNGVPNHGDFTAIDMATLGPVDLLVGGTPCQAFSVAGKRGSLSDARGNLSLAYTVLAHELARSHGLRWAVWENVPGVLSTSDNAFGCFLGALVGSDDAVSLPHGVGRWPDAGLVAGPRAWAAWRVLDAQYFGLAQRRRRVFVVASFGDGDPAAVLFEPKSLRGDHPPRRETGQGVAAHAGQSVEGGSGLIAGTVSSKWAKGSGGPAGDECYNLVAHTLRAEGHDASEDGSGRGVPLVPVAYRTSGNCGAWETGDRVDALICATDPNSHVIAFSSKDYGGDASTDLAPTLRSMGHAESHANAGGQLAVAYDLRGRDGGAQFEGPHDTANIRAALGGSSRSYVATQWAVRRLTPTECERLQGFPDDWTLVPDERGKMAADGPRYKQLGNSMAVPVMRWIGERTAADEARRAAA